MKSEGEIIAREDSLGEESTVSVLAKAVLGAMLGAIPAMFLWVVVGKVGYLAAICGFFMFLGEMYACHFFTKKSGQMNIQTAIIICVVVMLIDGYICQRIVWSWELSDFFSSEGYQVGFFECFKNFNKFMEDFGVQGDFTSSLIKSYLFAALGVVASIKKIANG
ncbi:MAG: hypothetical protein J6C96_07410 [Oscillospiraceae bacterium]|nr:hypothetical protein [Oscillospiraceae bacterium]